MIKKILKLALILIFLSSCSQYSESRKLTKIEKENLRVEKQRVEDTKSCGYYGFKKGTEEFSKCLMDLDLKRKQSEILAKTLECQNVRKDNSTSGVTGFWGGVLLGMRENLACN